MVKDQKDKRDSISKRMRFEVFKRDSFKCQYCGKKAPDVILEVDHIEPVSKGGKTDMLNLVTACYSCNRGKSNVALSDNAVIAQQKKALTELSEKQEQLKMLLKWRSGLLKIENQEIQAILKHWTELTGYTLNESGIAGVKKLQKEFGLTSVLDGMDITSKYLIYEDGSVTKESVENAFNKLKGVCYIRSLPEVKRKEYQELGSIKIFMQNKYYNYNYKYAPIYINRFIKAGNSIDLLKEIVDDCKSYKEWEYTIQKYLL
jgi:hypothetical protein